MLVLVENYVILTLLFTRLIVILYLKNLIIIIINEMVW